MEITIKENKLFFDDGEYDWEQIPFNEVAPRGMPAEFFTLRIFKMKAAHVNKISKEQAAFKPIKINFPKDKKLHPAFIIDKKIYVSGDEVYNCEITIMRR